MRISQARSTTAPGESVPSTSGVRRQNRRSNVSITYERLVFRYDPIVEDAGDKSANFRTMNKFCQYCSAFRFLLEPTGLYILCERKDQIAILAAINKHVDDLTSKIQSQIIGQIHSFKSIDSITDPNEVVNYPTEFLHIHYNKISNHQISREKFEPESGFEPPDF